MPKRPGLPELTVQQRIADFSVTNPSDAQRRALALLFRLIRLFGR